MLLNSFGTVILMRCQTSTTFIWISSEPYIPWALLVFSGYPRRSVLIESSSVPDEFLLYIISMKLGAFCICFLFMRQDTQRVFDLLFFQNWSPLISFN